MFHSTTDDFIPQFKPRTPVKLSSKYWLDFEELQIHLFQGMRISEKVVMMHSTDEKYKQLLRESIDYTELL